MTGIMRPVPVTLAHLLSALSLLIVMILWGINIAYKADDKSNQALLAAASARPHPYTSVNAAEDAYEHEKAHGTEGALIRQELLRTIETLPRPPKETEMLLASFGSRIFSLEQIVAECVKYDERLKALEQKSN